MYVCGFLVELFAIVIFSIKKPYTKNESEMSAINKSILTTNNGEKFNISRNSL